MKQLVRDKPMLCYALGTFGAAAVILPALLVGQHWEFKALWVADVLAGLLVFWVAGSCGFFLGAAAYSSRPEVRSWFWRNFPRPHGRKWLGEDAGAAQDADVPLSASPPA